MGTGIATSPEPVPTEKGNKFHSNGNMLYGMTADAYLKTTALSFFSSGIAAVRAGRDAPSMATWRYSKQPMRLLLWPYRSPVKRWPTLSMRLSLLISMSIDSPGSTRW